MGFGGKNRKATGRRPGIPHHPLARLRRWLERRTWGHVEVSINGVPLQGVSEISFETKLEPKSPAPATGFGRFQALVRATENAINKLLVEKAKDLGLDALGVRWRVDNGHLIVQPRAFADTITAEVSTRP